MSRMWAGLGGALRRGETRALRCSFCGRDEHEVARLIAGAHAYICDDCTASCVAVLEQHGGFDPPRAPGAQ